MKKYLCIRENGTVERFVANNLEEIMEKAEGKYNPFSSIVCKGNYNGDERYKPLLDIGNPGLESIGNIIKKTFIPDSKNIKNMNCVVGIIKDLDGKILIVKHKKLKAWTLPGGKLEPGENFKEAINRELFEELGIKVHQKQKIMSTIFTQKEYPVGSGNYTNFSQDYFDIKRYSGIITNKEPEKHTELRFVSIKELLYSEEYVNHISPTLKKYIVFKK